jgi:hypothetical protein
MIKEDQTKEKKDIIKQPQQARALSQRSCQNEITNAAIEHFSIMCDAVPESKQAICETNNAGGDNP